MRHQTLAQRAALSSAAATLGAAEQAEALARLREAAQWFGLLLLDATADSPSLRLQLITLLVQQARPRALGLEIDFAGEEVTEV